MPWNGSGVFTRLRNWVNEAASGIPILANEFDEQEQDFVVAGFGNCITRDGQGGPTANISWNGFGITNIASIASAAGGLLYTGAHDFTTATSLKATTQPSTDNSTSVANTAFVQSIAFGGPYSAALAINMFRNY